MSERMTACIDRSGLLYRIPRWRDYLRQSGEIGRLLLGIPLFVGGLWLYQPNDEPTCCPSQQQTTQIVTPTQSKETTEREYVCFTLPLPAVMSCLPPVPSPVWQGTAWLFLVWGGWLLLWRLLRGSLWAQMYRRGLADLIELERPSPPPLPGQQAFVERMAERLGGFSLLHPGPMWAIKGSWGSGKSHVMALLHRELESCAQVAVVNVHIWREQSETDLHLAIVDAILSHPKVLCACFARYPKRLVLRKLGQPFMRMLRGLRLTNGSLEAVLDPGKVLPLSAQRELETVVACARQKDLRIVVILDEVDRATVPVAQAAIVLTRRALGLPGLATVLPYVGEQLRLKVFNPLYDYSPDLHQTLLSHLESQYPPTVGKKADADSLVMKLAFESHTEDSGKRGGPRLGIRTHIAVRRALREETLLLHYLMLTKDQKQNLIEQSEEKYLSLRDNMPELGAGDVPKVLTFETVAPSLKLEWLQAIPGEAGWQALGVGVLRCDDDLSVDNLRPPVIRHFEGYAAEYFGQLQDFTDVVDDPALLMLWTTTLAWRKAQHIRGNN